jgi:mono/diheme cytochrome c family protein
MLRIRVLLLVAGCLALKPFPAGDGRLRAQQVLSPSPAAARAPHEAVIGSYCAGCHNQRLRTGGLAFDALDMSDVGARADVWEKVFQKLRMGAMPPPGLPRPDKPTLDAFIAWLETELDLSAGREPNPGRTGSVHRLNRFEYRNAVRDLLGLDIDVDALLPVDDADKNGFDNVATMLSVSPALLDRYLSAARKLSRLALGIPPVGPATDTYKAPLLLDQNGATSEQLPFGSRGGFAVQHYFPVDGEYVIKVRLRRQLYDYIVGLGSPHRIEVRVDGERVLASTVGGAATGAPPPASFVGEVFGDPAWEKYALGADAGLETRFRARAGSRIVGVAFLSRLTSAEDGVQPPKGSSRLEERDEMLEGNPAVDSLAIDGPYSVEGPGDTPSRRTILSCAPANAAAEPACARRILSALARRAYRRPITEAEVGILMRFFEDGRTEGSFDTGLQFAIERVLADPNFFFRIERDPANIAPDTAYRLSDLEIASRLSFFLWSSVPDGELLDVAASGRLKEPAVLEQQVRRMLASPRARAALVDNFVAQWLQLRPLRSATPSDAEFPDFDDNLREAFRQETNLFVASTLEEDRSVTALLSANYTFVNERLARHYQIPNVHGPRFRRVTLDEDGRRGGLLGHGSMLTVTSYPNRTSPVLRGKWLLENLLGTPPPPPPPDVPSLPDRGEGGKAASVRERLEQHRKNPVCASCHAPMDPLGFALEHYDGIGAWRTGEAGSPVDSSGTLPDGTRVDGLKGLRELLVSRREQFAGALTEKLLSYAIGRGLEYYDLTAVRRIVRESASDDYRWSSLILGIVRSVPFQMRRSRGEEAVSPVVAVQRP